MMIFMLLMERHKKQQDFQSVNFHDNYLLHQNVKIYPKKVQKIKNLS